MKHTYLILAVLLSFVMIMTSCNNNNFVEQNTVQSQVDTTSNYEDETTNLPDDETQNSNSELCEFDRLYEDTIAEIGINDEMTDYEIIEKCFVYIIESTFYIEYDNPTITQSWRSYPTCEVPPTYYEELAFGVLKYGIGSCENFAAAMMVLLEGLGFEVRYVPGYTASVGGNYVVHAWTMVKVDDRWYHLDSQLEDNISFEEINFKYFMKDDNTFYSSHIWGERLVQPNEYDLSLPYCDGIIETPQARTLVFRGKNYTVEDAVKHAEQQKAKAGDLWNDIVLEDSMPPFPTV